LTPQQTLGSPSTSSYNLGTSESTSPSYAPYGLFPKNNLDFPFSRSPQPVFPPHGQPHANIKFFHLSPIQQIHTFEQLNMENPSHESNNAKNKGKNRNNNNTKPGGNNLQQNQPAGGNHNQGN
jgi:hypothetical protein